MKKVLQTINLLVLNDTIFAATFGAGSGTINKATMYSYPNPQILPNVQDVSYGGVNTSHASIQPKISKSFRTSIAIHNIIFYLFLYLYTTLFISSPFYSIKNHSKPINTTYK